ncbi:MAG: hypothetical protein KDA25_01245, partial [Phycisphaerales bacterium]|nr:hypothetical protein [Phycisphaerales bacterium]
VSVRTGLDHDAVDVGTPIRLTIEVTAEPGVDVTMPILEPTTGPFETAPIATPPDIPDGEQRRWTHVYGLDTFDSGDLAVPGVTILFVDRRDATADAISGTIETDPLTVHVRSVTGPDDGARDIRGMHAVTLPEDERRRSTRTLLIIGAAVVAVAAVIAIIIALRRRAAPGARPVPVVPPHVWARRELDALRAARLVEQGRFEPYYDRLSAIVRGYIERRFGIMAPERTTQEFLIEARRSDALSVGQQVMLGTFLRAADLVKFALVEPTPADADEAIGAAAQFVDETTPTAGEAAA